MDGIKVGSALPSASDGDETHLFQLRDIANDAAKPASHIFCQPVLTGKAFIEFAGVFEEHGIGKFRANGNLFALKNEVWNPGPAALGGNVCAS